MGLAGNFITHQILMILSLRTRISVFDKSHLYPFNEIHKKEVGTDSKVDYAGMPDQGNGWYSRALSYEKWVAFNNAQRTAMNYVESFPQLIMFTLVSGIYYPNLSLAGVWIYILGRILYSFGYRKETRYRIPGAFLQMIVMLMIIILSFSTCYQFSIAS